MNILDRINRLLSEGEKDNLMDEYNELKKRLAGLVKSGRETGPQAELIRDKMSRLRVRISKTKD